LLHSIFEGLESGYANSIKPKATSFRIDVIDIRSAAVNFNGLLVLCSKNKDNLIIHNNNNYVYKNNLFKMNITIKNI